ncbi:MAG: hypothetical protein KF893_26495, partial [Caldilineaceae bacterium]|nr:hypothetical protein [Caldilineaceae bacterium]
MKLRQLVTLLLTLVLLLQSFIVPAAAQDTLAEEAPPGFTSTDSQANLYSISGQVKDGSGNGIAGVTVTATKSKPPLIFIPGAGGSVLKDPNREWPLWPNLLEPDENLRIVVTALTGGVAITALIKAIMARMAGNATDLQLKANDPATNLVAPDVLRWVVNSGSVKIKDIYGSFLSDFLEDKEGYRPYQLTALPGYACDESQADNHPTLFVFPYDWRLPIEQSAQRLAHYVDCVHKFYPETEIDIVAHSMGGLVARRYILDQVDAKKPSYIRRMVTMGTPWLGAPKMLHAMLTGNFDLVANLLLLNKNVLSQLLENYPGVHSLLPSKKYFQFAIDDRDVLVERGWDINKNNQKDETYTYADYKAWLDTQKFPEVTPVTTNEAFHNRPGQDGWNNDSSGVE